MDERVIVTREPLNAETPLDRQLGLVTPAGRHYVRTHFGIPAAPSSLAVGGTVERPFEISPEELRGLPSRSLLVTLECAGNGRAFLDPPAPGEPWRLGAVGTAEWTGAQLAALLERARPRRETIEVLFRGADRGPLPHGKLASYERSLPLGRARDEDVLVAYAMNGEPLPPEHGAPFRLVVPGWYGMAAVKWLAEIIAIDVPFGGFYQADRYVIGDQPLRAIRTRAVIVAPRDGERHSRQRMEVRGYAWSGEAPIARVALSTNGGATWRDTRLGPAVARHAWREWRLDWTPERSGAHTLIARATDAAGAEQPLAQRRNVLGYANNAAQPTRLIID